MEQINENKKAIIVGVCIHSEDIFNYEMKELASLCEACNIDVIKSIVQNLDSFNLAYYCGSGKIEEIAYIAKEEDVDFVIFNDELSPSTLNNISNIIDCVIYDRTMLILEIFKTRAKTKEATIQVELANLSYMLPRLIGARNNLSRLGGGSSGSGGARRGLGETKLELDRRLIEKRISKLKEELSSIVKDRKTGRILRKKTDTKVIAFVGYTNAGKSSTINSILEHVYGNVEDKNVFVKDMLFATLDTTTRRIKLENNHEFLITDTVGFVNKLPHHLVESFKSTLEEIQEASLIIHLIDASSPNSSIQVETTNKVLSSLGCASVPTLYVYNKTDLITNESLFIKEYEPSMQISNVTKEGIHDLINYIDKFCFKDEITTTLLIPYYDASVHNTLLEKANVHSTEYTNDGILINVTLSIHLYELNKKYEKISD